MFRIEKIILRYGIFAYLLDMLSGMTGNYCLRLYFFQMRVNSSIRGQNVGHQMIKFAINCKSSAASKLKDVIVSPLVFMTVLEVSFLTQESQQKLLRT